MSAVGGTAEVVARLVAIIEGWLDSLAAKLSCSELHATTPLYPVKRLLIQYCGFPSAQFKKLVVPSPFFSRPVSLSRKM
jgi:hypothetical protein